jgi:hypothetical protein
VNVIDEQRNPVLGQIRRQIKGLVNPRIRDEYDEAFFVDRSQKMLDTLSCLAQPGPTEQQDLGRLKDPSKLRVLFGRPAGDIGDVRNREQVLFNLL